MTQEEIKSHQYFKEKRDELRSLLSSSDWWLVGSFLAFFITVQLVIMGEGTILGKIIVWIIFILSIVIFISILIIRSKLNDELYNLQQKYRILDLKMKGYEKQLKGSGLNVNLNQNDKHEKLEVKSSNSTVIQKLDELKKMKDNKYISEEEYESKRKQIIDKY